MIVDLQKNPKQFDFFCEVIKATQGISDKRKFLYGGAIRGGKSFICATIFLYLANKHHGTRWHVIRADFPALVGTIIPTFEKIIHGANHYRWSRDKSNYFLENTKSKSKIFFRGENLSSDPNLNDFLGLETNGIYYEQIEELSEKLWNIGNSRNGSWYVKDMPKPVVLATFNPSQSWIKERIHNKFIEGTLPEEYYYQLAYPTDNAFVTEEQKLEWSRLDERYRRQFIQGDWTNFDSNGSRWAYAYEPDKHLHTFEVDKNREVILSFDFNRNPMCCSVAQVYDSGTINVLETIKLPNSDIYQMCDYIIGKYGYQLYLVTGDASGNSGSAMVSDNLNYYKIIASKLMLNIRQFQVPTVNPRIAENRVLVNSLLSRGNVKLHKENTKALQFDLENVSVLPDGTLKKQDRNDPAQQADALDTFRYLCNIFCSTFVTR